MDKPIFRVILAAALDGTIGKVVDGKHGLPWDHIPNDLPRFQKLTKGGVVVMGRNTFNSLPAPLPYRQNVVISSTKVDVDGVLTFSSVESALTYLLNQDKPVWVIGGASVVFGFLPWVEELYMTHVFKSYDGDEYIKIDFDKLMNFKDCYGQETNFVHIESGELSRQPHALWGMYRAMPKVVFDRDSFKLVYNPTLWHNAN